MNSVVSACPSNNIIFASYNVTASFFDAKNPSHEWSNRFNPFKELMKQAFSDVINTSGTETHGILGLQELSPLQAHQIGKFMKEEFGWTSIFFTQTPSDVSAGLIVDYQQVVDWIPLNIGTALTGFIFSPKLILESPGQFWLNENPHVTPDVPGERNVTDCGFGNKATYRLVAYLHLTIPDVAKVVAFTSHYPLSGTNETRYQCAKLEMKKIDEIVSRIRQSTTLPVHFFTGGDRNTIPDGIKGSIQRVYQTFLEPTANLPEIYDIREAKEHLGIDTTWIGFSYDKFLNPLTEENGIVSFQNKSCLDYAFSDMIPRTSFYFAGEINPVTHELVGIHAPLTNNKARLFVSDHALIGGIYELV